MGSWLGYGLILWLILCGLTPLCSLYVGISTAKIRACFFLQGKFAHSGMEIIAVSSLIASYFVVEPMSHKFHADLWVRKRTSLAASPVLTVSLSVVSADWFFILDVRVLLYCAPRTMCGGFGGTLLGSVS